MEKLKKTLERLFWKRKYISELERQIRSLKVEYSELERKLMETERLNRGLTSDLMFLQEKIQEKQERRREMTRFRAERHRIYFLIAYDMKVISMKEEGCGMDELAYNSGNYFETKAEAEEVAAKFRAVLKEHHNRKGGKE